VSDACAPALPEGRFALVEHGRWSYSGALTTANAGAVLEAARALPLPLSGVIDCAGIAPFDSAAVAVLVALKRRAAAEGQPLAFTGLSPALTALADLYAVEDVLAL